MFGMFDGIDQIIIWPFCEPEYIVLLLTANDKTRDV
jgi:hypothetical protein